MRPCALASPAPPCYSLPIWGARPFHPRLSVRASSARRHRPSAVCGSGGALFLRHLRFLHGDGADRKVCGGRRVLFQSLPEALSRLCRHGDRDGRLDAWTPVRRPPFSRRAAGAPTPSRAWLIAINVVVAGQDVFELMRQASLPAVRALFGDSSSIRCGCSGRPSVVAVRARCSSTRWRRSWCARRGAPLALLVASLAVRGLTIGVFGLSSNIWGYFFFPATLCMFLHRQPRLSPLCADQDPAHRAPRLARARSDGRHG